MGRFEIPDGWTVQVFQTAPDLGSHRRRMSDTSPQNSLSDSASLAELAQRDARSACA
jgi:hypothetical protein